MNRSWSQDDKEKLLEGITNKLPFSELEKKVGRSGSAIYNKLYQFSSEDPERFATELIKPYISEYVRRQEQRPKALPFLLKCARSVPELGYAIETAKLDDNQLEIVLEGDDISMPDAVEDFKSAMKQADFTLPIQLKISCEGQAVIMRPDDKMRYDIVKRSRKFLAFYCKVLEEKRTP